jgi:oligosaccharide reducing-end xylanase
MKHFAGRRTLLILASFSALPLVLGACGGPSGDEGASVPAYAPPVGSPFPSTDAPGSMTTPATEPAAPNTPAQTSDNPGEDSPANVPLDMTPVATVPGSADPPPEEPAAEEPPAPSFPPAPPAPSAGTRNMITELLGIPEDEVFAKVSLVRDRIFGIGTNEQTQPPVVNSGYRIYYELPQDRSLAYIWAVDSNDIRSEGMSYGMIIAAELDMQDEFDKLWRFTQRFMQFPANGNAAWRYYSRWRGSVNTGNANNWQVQFANEGPASDGDEYFAAALYLANRRWGSDGGVNYLQEAQNISSAMLNNPTAGTNTPIISRQSNQVVFVPNSFNQFSDPSYHLPAFYELFAQDGPQNDSARWRQVAQTSRQYFVTSANAQTGLHPDYANFDGSPNAGGARHNEFRFDAWRVILNMAVDFAWTGEDQRLETQIEKYHSFFTQHLGPDNVEESLFTLAGTPTSAGDGSTALTATLAAGAQASSAANRADFVRNLWAVEQQSGQYRYYQQLVYLLGLLATSGRLGYEFDTPQ